MTSLKGNVVSLYTNVVLNERHNVMVNGDKLTGTTERLTL